MIAVIEDKLSELWSGLMYFFSQLDTIETILVLYGGVGVITAIVIFFYFMAGMEIGEGCPHPLEWIIIVVLLAVSSILLWPVGLFNWLKEMGEMGEDRYEKRKRT